MLRKLMMGAAMVLLVTGISLAGQATDSDGDGIRDEHEEVLGSDPKHPDKFHLLLDNAQQSEQRRQAEGYDAGKDVVKLEFCHVGGDRYLWRATLAAPPKLEDTVFHLYVDADADAKTGRQGNLKAASTGTEYMLSVVGGRASSQYYDADGNGTNGPLVSFVVDGNALIVSADVDLGRDEKGIRYALYVLCHTVTQSGRRVPMSDSTGKRVISGIPVSNRKKVMRPRDYPENHLVDATFGHQRLLRVTSSDKTIVVPVGQLEMDGFVVDDQTNRRWPHLRRERSDARVWTTAPKPGRYYVGFMMYDDSNDERVVFHVDGKVRGVAVANQDNNRTWLYWLKEPLELRGNERIELRAAGGRGKHGICNILFMTERPETRALAYEIQDLVAATHLNRPGKVTISWTTTWPCATRFEYGEDSQYGKTVVTDGYCLVHRAVLSGLDPGKTYHGRAIATRRDGSRYSSEDFSFHARTPALPATRTDTVSIPITVTNPSGKTVRKWPVTTGVPFPEGELGSVDHIRLMGPQGELPAQYRVTCRWPDQSIKWVLVTLLVDITKASQAYRLEYGQAVRHQKVTDGAAVKKDAAGAAIDTGAMKCRIDRQGNVAKVTCPREGAPTKWPGSVWQATDGDGQAYTTRSNPAEITIEEDGPVRVVVRTVNHLRGKGGRKLLRLEQRIEAYAGSALLRIHCTFIVDNPDKFTVLERLAYHIPTWQGHDPGWLDHAVASNAVATLQKRLKTGAHRAQKLHPETPTKTSTRWEVPLVNDPSGMTLGPGEGAVRQLFDDQFVRVSGEQEIKTKGRILGTLSATGEGGFAVAVRDFWQNYPKAFALGDDGVDIELCPDFEKGIYDRFPFEKEGHQLYYYLLDGHYRLKHGLSKTHEMLLCFEPPARRSAACALVHQPVLATVDPNWMCKSKAFYSVAARDTKWFPLYEQAIDKNVVAYAARRERQHDFGMLNYGDWYGERGTNWGNIEYDTQHAMFLEYIRSGSRQAFLLGEAAELHNRDIDTVQWSDDPKRIGAVYVHQMCHVGEYYDKPVPGSLGFPRGGYTVSHAWTEGHFDHYFLTGDPRSWDTGRAVTDFFIRKELGRPYDFSTCRVPGWHLIMLAATYAATGDPYYLNAAKVVVRRVLETQDKLPRPLPAYHAKGRQPYQQGGWSRMMVPGHCRCHPRHRGNAGFMVAVLLSGLKYYHDVTKDPDVKEAIIAGANYLLDETYSDQAKGFRYTSCPEMGYRPGATPLMVEGVARAYLWTRDERFRRVLTEALPIGAGGSSYGKGFSMYYRMAPRVLADLKAAGLKLEKGE